MKSIVTESALIRTPAKLNSSSCYSTFSDKRTNQIQESTSSIYFQKPLQEESHKNQKSTLSELNDDIFQEIFSFFSHSDFKKMSLVCRQHYIILRNEHVQIPFEIKFCSSRVHGENFVYKKNWTSLLSEIRDCLDRALYESRYVPCNKKAILLKRLILATLLSIGPILFHFHVMKYGSEDQQQRLIQADFAILIIFCLIGLCYYTLNYNKTNQIRASNEFDIFNELKMKRKEIDGFISFLDKQKEIFMINAN